LDASDPVLLKVIAAHPNLSETDYRALESWWLMERQPAEGIVDFMIRQNIFVKDAPRTMDMLRKGILTYCDPKRLFGDQGHARLHEYAKSVGFYGNQEPKRGLPLTTEPKSKPLTMPGVPNRLSEVKEWLAKRAEKNHHVSVPAASEAGSTHAHVPVHAPVAKSSRSSASLGGPYSPVPDRPTLLDRRRFPEVGDQVGKYFLTEEVARGGTAVVYRALNRSLNSTVAIKVLKMDREEGLTNEQAEMLDSLRREAQLLARFNHPNLVRVFDLDEEATYPFLVLEFVDGLSLHETLNHVGRIRLNRAVSILTHVIEGLSEAQRKIGLVHRDIKPGNILLGRDGCVKLADLGLAMTTDTWSSTSSANSSILAGTAAYMAPELCTSGEVDHRTDIYSLGSTFYHMVVGEMPFKGKNRMEIMLKHTKDMPIAPHERYPGLDSSVSDVILKMMAKNLDDRYQSYEELLHELSLISTRSNTELAMPALTG
jgi:tRNA A-37 threonylcarbamoyl transferase component Bud32